MKRIKKFKMRNLDKLIEYRCQCGKLLCKGFLVIGVIMIKCKRCGQICSFEDCQIKTSIQMDLTSENGFLNSARFSKTECNGKKYVFTVL